MIVFILILCIHPIWFAGRHITHKRCVSSASMMTCNSSFFVLFLLLWRCFRFDTVSLTQRELNVLSLFNTNVSLKHTFVSCMNCYVTETVRRYGFTFRFGLWFFAMRPFFLFFTFVDGILSIKTCICLMKWQFNVRTMLTMFLSYHWMHVVFASSINQKVVFYLW